MITQPQWDAKFKLILEEDKVLGTETLNMYRTYTKQLLSGNETAKTLLYEAILMASSNSAKKLIDLLDYITSSHSTRLIQIIDNAQFIENFFKMVRKHSLTEAVAVLMAWKEKVKETAILFRDRLLDLVLDDASINKIAKEKPKLQYLKSQDPNLQVLYEKYLTIKLDLPEDNTEFMDNRAIKNNLNALDALCTEIKGYKSAEKKDNNDIENSLLEKLTQEVQNLKNYLKETNPKDRKKTENKERLEKQAKEIKDGTKVNEISPEFKNTGEIQEPQERKSKEKKDKPKDTSQNSNEIKPFNQLQASNPELSAPVSSFNESEQIPVFLRQLVAQNSNSTSSAYPNNINQSPSPQVLQNASISPVQINMTSSSSSRSATESIMTFDELLTFKTQKCDNDDCNFKPTKTKSEKFKNKDLKCVGYHFNYDRRREIDIQDSKFNYHAKACENNPCKYKQKCYFSHNFFESYFHPLYYKKFSCAQNLGDTCDRSKYCPYVHTKEEEARWDNILKSRLGIDRSLNKDMVIGNFVNKSNSSDENKDSNEDKKAGNGNDYILKINGKASGGCDDSSGVEPDKQLSKKNKNRDDKIDKDKKDKNGKFFKKKMKDDKELDSIKEKKSKKRIYANSPDNSQTPITDIKVLLSRTSFTQYEVFSLQNEFRICFTNKVDYLRDQKFRCITETISAFLNGDGGYIFIGIEKKGQVFGCDLSFEEQDRLRNNIINVLQKFSPKPQVAYYKVEVFSVKDSLNNILQDKVIFRIKVEKGDPDKFYANDAGEYFYRVSGKTKKYTAAEVRDHILQIGMKQKQEQQQTPLIQQSNQLLQQNGTYPPGLNSQNPLSMTNQIQMQQNPYNLPNVNQNLLLANQLSNQLPSQLPNQLPNQMTSQLPGQLQNQISNQLQTQLPNQLNPIYSGFFNPQLNQISNYQSLNSLALQQQQNLGFQQFPGYMPNSTNGSNQFFPGNASSTNNNTLYPTKDLSKASNGQYQQGSIPTSQNSSNGNGLNYGLNTNGFIPQQQQQQQQQSQQQISTQMSYGPNLGFSGYGPYGGFSNGNTSLQMYPQQSFNGGFNGLGNISYQMMASGISAQQQQQQQQGQNQQQQKVMYDTPDNQ